MCTESYSTEMCTKRYSTEICTERYSTEMCTSLLDQSVGAGFALMLYPCTWKPVKWVSYRRIQASCVETAL
jgi:hypothetical protein